jgi:hypothetical protein
VSCQQIYNIWRFICLLTRWQTPVWTLATQPSLTRSQPDLSSSADSQCCTNINAMRSPRMVELSRIMPTIRGVISRGSCFHSGSQCSMCSQYQELVDVVSYHPVRLVLFSLCVGFSQPPILTSVQSVVHRSNKHSALGIQLFRWTWLYPKSQHGQPSSI